MSSTNWRRRLATIVVSASLLSFGFGGLTSSGVGASSAPKLMPLQRGALKLHLSWVASTGGTSLSGAFGRLRINAAITRPNPAAPRYVVKGSIDGLNLHVVLVEGMDSSGVTFTAKGSFGNRTLTTSGTLRTSTSGGAVVTFTGKIGVTKISGRIPLTSFTSASGVVKVG